MEKLLVVTVVLLLVACWYLIDKILHHQEVLDILIRDNLSIQYILTKKKITTIDAIKTVTKKQVIEVMEEQLDKCNCPDCKKRREEKNKNKE
jgi:hypothetical protein